MRGSIANMCANMWDYPVLGRRSKY